MAKIHDENTRLRGTLSYLATQARNGTLHPQVVIQNAEHVLDGKPLAVAELDVLHRHFFTALAECRKAHIRRAGENGRGRWDDGEK